MANETKERKKKSSSVCQEQKIIFIKLQQHFACLVFFSCYKIKAEPDGGAAEIDRF